MPSCTPSVIVRRLYPGALVMLEHVAVMGEGRAVGGAVQDDNERYRPFPLTDIQHAYWVGRSSSLELGNVACHVYFEWALGALDVQRLEKAWNEVIRRHDMMRAIIQSDGRQRILPEVPWYIIMVDSPCAEDGDQAVSMTRDRMSRQVLDAGTWPLFEMRVTRLSDACFHLHLDIDLLMFDVQSFHVFLADLERLYAGMPVDPPPFFSFRDYVLATEKKRGTSAWNDARSWWLQRLPDMAPPPDLPLAVAPSSLPFPRFRRHIRSLAPQAWSCLMHRAAEHGLTGSAVLLAAFSEVLAYWSRSPRFTINLTHFNRERLHPDVMRLVGDFTSVLLVTVDCTENTSLYERAQNIQKEMWSGLAHRVYSGVDVMRDVSRLSGTVDAGRMPVVFTSLLGMDIDHLADMEREGALLGEPICLETATPQVWLDHQVMVRRGELVWNWIVIEDLFPPGLVEGMMDAYDRLLASLVDSEQAWQQPIGSLLTAAQLEPRQSANATGTPFEPFLLHHPVFEHGRNGGLPACAPALFHGAECLDYATLLQRSEQLAACLDIEPGDSVAVVLPKGPEQIIAVLAVLEAGGVYVPVTLDTPRARLAQVLDNAGVRLVLCHQDHAVPGHMRRLDPSLPVIPKAGRLSVYQPRQPEDLAYVIYTSGSTGIPKGVMISHQAAANTVADISRRFAVGPHDRVLGLSSLAFDLSVYDIFGVLGAGGALVLPDEDQRLDPLRWVDLMDRHGVTIWNTVPALLELLVDVLEKGQAKTPYGLRLVLLSGDWIPVGLPGRLRVLFPDVRIIAMGGATEASIWSNWFEIRNVDPAWRSIPYGFPLSNQRYHVLDRRWRDRPDYVAGDLYIAGAGLADGYQNDPEKTAQSFVQHPQTGERLYRTGDMACYWPDGALEFLGREDNQVKVAGQRIELGDIEAALIHASGVRDAVAVFTPGISGGSGGRITAFVVPVPMPAANSAFSLLPSLSADRYQRACEALSVPVSGLGPDIQACAKAFGVAGDRLALSVIETVLARRNVFGGSVPLTMTDIMRRSGIAERYAGLLEQWIKALVVADVLVETDAGTFSALRPLRCDPDAGQAFLQDLKSVEADFENFRITDWVAACIEHCDELLDGHLDPVEVLFPGGDSALAGDLYRNNPLSAPYGKMVAAVVRAFADAALDSTVSVIEVGAGTGGTTAHVLPVLDPGRSQYIFTDISPFFLDHSRSGFSDCPFLQTACWDISKPPSSAGLGEHSADIVIASNVLHDVRDIPAALANLRSVLKPGGLLVLREATRHNLLQLVTAGFLEGFGHFTDFRRDDGRPLVDAETWCRVLEDVGFLTICVSDAGAAWTGQHVFIARTPGRAVSLDQSALVRELSEHLPPGMLPSSFIVLDRFPLGLNGKVDRKALASLVPSVTAGCSADAAYTPLEKTIATVWADILGDMPGPGDNFFLSGGDSLLATHLVSRLRTMGCGTPTLRLLFENPVLRDFAVALDASGSAPSLEPDNFPAVLHLKTGVDAKAHLILLPGSDGMATLFAPLAARLDATISVTALRTPGLAKGEQPACSLNDLVQYFRGVIGQLSSGLGSCPLYLGGWSFGALAIPGLISALKDDDISVAGSILLDPPPVGAFAHGHPDPSGMPAAPKTSSALMALLGIQEADLDHKQEQALVQRFAAMVQAHRTAMQDIPTPFVDPVGLVITATEVPPEWQDLPAWPGGIVPVLPVQGNHWSLLTDPVALDALAEAIETIIRCPVHTRS